MDERLAEVPVPGRLRSSYTSCAAWRRIGSDSITRRRALAMRRILEFAMSLFFLPRLALNFALPPVRAFERRIFDALIERAPTALRPRISAQLGSINLAQLVTFKQTSRLTFWHLGLGSLTPPAATRLSLPEGEACVAKLTVRLGGNGSPADKLELWAVDGYLSSLRCHFRLDRVRERSDVEVENVEFVVE